MKVTKITHPWHFDVNAVRPKENDQPIFYSYQKLDDKCIQTLLNRSLYASDPASFNDPFDCWASLKVAWKTYEECLPFYNKLVNNYISKHPKAFRSGLVTDMNEAMLEIENIFRSGSKEIGIVCLSDNWNNNLMWSHYAEAHKGMCVGYASKGLLAIDGERLFEPVLYNGHFLIDVEDAFNSDCSYVSETAATGTLRTKSSEWSYEREWRILCKSEEKGQRVPLASLNTEVKEITFGFNVPDWKVRSTIHALRENKLSPKFYKTYFSRDQNSIDRNEIDEK